MGLLLIWGFFAQAGVLPSPFLLLSPEQLCFCPSQTLCPDFHVGAFSSGIFVTHESSPLNLDSFPAEKQRRQTFLGWAALVFSFSRASKTLSGDDLLFRIPKLNKITTEGMGIMIVGSQEGVAGGLSSDASRSCRPGVGQSS